MLNVFYAFIGNFMNPLAATGVRDVGIHDDFVQPYLRALMLAPRGIKPIQLASLRIINGSTENPGPILL
jgi:hypothetical protein